MRTGRKPLASLSPALLAREGQAKPALRTRGLIDLTQSAMTPQDVVGALPAVLVQRDALRRAVESPGFGSPARTEPTKWIS